MSERGIDPVEIVHQLHGSDGVPAIDTDDIIDVTSIDFDDDERWLYVSSQCSPESTVHDLRTWLRSDPEMTSDNETSAKRSIDTRTFTRPKKRSNRMSFESIMEALSPPVQNTWKTEGLNLLKNQENISEEPSSMEEKKESVPLMLRPISTVLSGLLSNNSFSMTGQESMDAFLNMSQSKGIDSFINLTEPELHESLMSLSQPSELNSSILSITRNESPYNLFQNHMEDSQILTDSMMRTSMFNESADLKNFDETFLKDNSKDVTLVDQSYNCNPGEKTFISKPQFDKVEDLNDTIGNYGPKSLPTLPRRSLALDLKKEAMNQTFTASSLLKNSDVNSTLVNSQHKEEDEESEDAHSRTYRADNSKTNAMNTTIHIESNYQEEEYQKSRNNDIDTDKVIQGQTFRVHDDSINSSFKQPSSLRRELLEEIQRSNLKKLNSSYDNIADKQIARRSVNLDTTYNHAVNAPVDRYNTYRKEPTRAQVRDLNVNCEILPRCNNDLNEHRFSTFTKRVNNIGAKGDTQSKESLQNLDATFSKPLPNLPRKLRQPRVLSKLPQYLQKSNPNLVSSSLKSVNMIDHMTMPNLRYIKGSQPNIARSVEVPLTNKLYTLGKLKSGSEQRLPEVAKSTADLKVAGASGSTESIESTQSAHSAPDLDDRLSICSDSSHSSYNMNTMNIDRLHQIARMQEESLKQESTPKPHRKVLENTWIDTSKDLPSPILKNGLRHNESNSTSPRSVNSAVKTSSPILSPEGSSQSIDTIGNHLNEGMCIIAEGHHAATKKTETFVKPVKCVEPENKPKLRQPTNWSSSNRLSSIGSGIPRPASRIPAPRFSRLNVKSNQGDAKKGYL
ncbi:uncharacterized protein LOC105696058 [Orussus abietinus]|uniref:uncharacterized protein LOC105696058 n=1 Tax=Orussus abietinus TaxID=222816 RepID=UPI0006255398|nr:uncharacterized protein LOC105696058 [Orussus abietinus]